jgi:hypothetical protein
MKERLIRFLTYLRLNNQQIGNISDSTVVDANVNGEEIKTIYNDLAHHKAQLNNLDDRINNLEGNKRKFKYDYVILLGAITVFAALFFFLVVGLNRRYCFGISDDGIVIAFAGILATFIVISNYMQVRDVKNDFSIKIAELEEEKIFFESKNTELLSLMYLEVAKIYYTNFANQLKDNDYKHKLNYKINMLNAIVWASKTGNSSTCESIDEFLLDIRVAFPRFYDKDKLHINKISQQINLNKIKEIGDFKNIEKFIFE